MCCRRFLIVPVAVPGLFHKRVGYSAFLSLFFPLMFVLRVATVGWRFFPGEMVCAFSVLSRMADELNSLFDVLSADKKFTLST